ncbi:hypothetical protein ACH5RR_025095 [Cinchona calisaya]|uniref:Uncharacterized protein n=1 Tax=Cinchona calisaya TaxID=153742 RepID=A0ABD2YZQ7_9GENT
MAEGTVTPRSLTDVDGTLTKSEFLDCIGTKLHMSPVSSSYNKFLVFWNEEDDESDSYQTLFSNVGPSLLTTPIIKDKVKIALQHVDLSYNVSILAQFWVPVTAGGRQFLITSDQPFGLTSLRKGLCCYRKYCLNYSYCISGGGSESAVSSTGPPSRVFVRGLPEYSPNVEFYSNIKEYHLRDEAMRRRIKNYMAVPVFDPTSQDCIGVLELVSTPGLIGEMDKPAYIFGLISTALQGVGLRTSKFACHFNTENDLAKSSTGLSHALHDIRKALEETCRSHNLPFAQTWKHSYMGNVMSTTSDEYYLSHTRFSLLRDTCESFQLLSGRGVVWRAFASGKPCFCRDITMLSIAEYSFAHIARKVLLDSSLAICLKSDHTGDDVYYVLELFLPCKTADPRLLLESVLLIMKNHLDSFRLASGQKLGDEMLVEVLRVSKEDKLDFLRLFHDATGGSVGLPDQSSSVDQLLFSDEGTDWEFSTIDNARDIVDEQWGSYLECLPKEDASVPKCSLAVNNDLSGWNKDSCDTQSVKGGSSYINSSVSTSRFPGKDYSNTMVAEDHNTVDHQNAISSDHKVESSDTKEGRSSASVSERINHETIMKHCGLTLKDAARSLKVSPTTLKRKCRKLGIPSWPRMKNQANCSTTSIESKKDNEKHNSKYGQEGLNSNMSTEDGPTCSKQNFSQAATVTSNSSMIIKAAYGEKILVKFELPFSSRLVDLEKEIILRLKLADFSIWYQDEDKEWILLTCDADLRTMESMGKTTIRVSVTHCTDAATS